MRRRLDDEVESPNDGEVLRTTMRVYGSIYAVLLLVFCCVRKRFKAYNIRDWSPKIQTNLASEQHGFINWMWRLYVLSEDDLMENCGFDSLCFLRMLEFGFKVSLVGIFNSIWLMPIYATAPDSDETAHIDDRIVQVSVSNVPPSSPRLIATAIASWIIFCFTMYLILREFEWFTRRRHQFLSKTLPRNYTLYIIGVPDEYRSSSELLAFFRECFSYDAVLEARIALTIPSLEKKVARRDTVIAKLEHAIALEERDGVAPTHLVSLKGEKVNSIEAYSRELSALNRDIAEAIETIEFGNAPQTYRRDLEDALSKSVTYRSLQPRSEHAADNSVVSSVTGAVDMCESSSIPADTNKQLSVGEDGVESEDDKAASEDSTKPASQNGLAKFGESTLKMGSKIGSTAKALFSSEEGTPREAGFVTFKSLTATHAALQMLHYSKPFSMYVSEAPEPEDIFWGNVGKTHEQLQTGTLIGLSLTGLLCLFWTFPVAFVSSLSSVDALKESIPFLEDWIDSFPALEQILAQLAPLLIVLLNVLLPYIVIEFAKLEGPVSTSVLEVSLFVKLAAFMIIQTFFVGSISGSVTSSISDIIDDPSLVIDLLATTLPTQAIFYVQILLVSTFLGQGLELLRVLALLIAWIRGLVGPNLTEKERNSVWMWLYPLAEPWEFEYAEVLAEEILYFMVTFVYSSLAPVTNYFLALCYLLLGSGYRHQFIHIYPPTPDSGGKLWIGFIGIVQTCMLIAEFTIFGYFGLKKAPVAAGLMVPLIIITVLFNFYVRQEHFRVTDNLPSDECNEVDRKNNRDGTMDFSFVRGAYLQPAMQEKRALPDNFSTAREIAHEPLPFLPCKSDLEEIEELDSPLATQVTFAAN